MTIDHQCNANVFFSINQQCVWEMFLAVKWRHLKTGEKIVYNYSQEFTTSYTDYGVCCKIYPQLGNFNKNNLKSNVRKFNLISISDFENPDTRHIHVDEYKSRLTIWCIKMYLVTVQYQAAHQELKSHTRPFKLVGCLQKISLNTNLPLRNRSLNRRVFMYGIVIQKYYFNSFLFLKRRRLP